MSNTAVGKIADPENGRTPGATPGRRFGRAPGRTPGRDTAEAGPGPTGPPYDPLTPRPSIPRVRGRHRRPRRRKALLAAGGLVLAAGVLSLVRLTPEPGVGGLGGAVEGEPRPDPGDDRSTNAAATVAAVSEGSPSAIAVLGAPSAIPTPGISLAPTTSTASAARPSSAPATGGTATTPAPTATTPRTPHPSTGAQPTAPPAPEPPAPTAAPTPQQPEQPGDEPVMCVPVVGLCVNPVDAAPGPFGPQGRTTGVRHPGA